jgi:hypothetical protein
VQRGVSDSVNTKSKLPADPQPTPRTRARIWPWAWLILEGIATVGWLWAIAWGGVRVVRWLFG